MKTYITYCELTYHNKDALNYLTNITTNCGDEEIVDLIYRISHDRDIALQSITKERINLAISEM